MLRNIPACSTSSCKVGETPWLLIILCPPPAVIFATSLGAPPTAWCPHDKSGSCPHAVGPATSPSLVLSGVCSRDQWCWRISQVICTDLENQRGSSFCPGLEAATQLCLARLKNSAARDTVRTATPKSGCWEKCKLSAQTWYKNPNDPNGHFTLFVLRRHS